MAGGVQWMKDTISGTGQSETQFAYETGSKFRFNINFTRLRFLRHLGSDFWGVRVGLQAREFPDVSNITWVVEIGAGVCSCFCGASPRLGQ